MNDFYDMLSNVRFHSSEIAFFCSFVHVMIGMMNFLYKNSLALNNFSISSS
ncbi:uncharacterized protein DS421_3g73600 [Arachis hypogaea]|nr:uncharacterized protein DS421_3g73600 [Arachis hypogaea]